MKPSYHARRGAILAVLATIVWALIVGALNLESGLGLLADFSFAALITVVGIPLVAALVALILAILGRLPRIQTGFFVASVVFVSLLWFSKQGVLFAALLLFVECCFGAALATILRRGLNNAPLVKRLATWSILLLSVAANIGIFALLSNNAQPPPALNALPGGPYKVQTLYYGSGDSLRRPEFGPSVAIKTRSVDASVFGDFGGWKAFIRKRYWGFGMDKLPLNAQVFYPEGAGPFPLFLIVHGNHEMSIPSDKGYGYLCESLASRGFIAVSVDENFLNSGLFHDVPDNQVVRGWLLLEHLRLWHQWVKLSGNPFYEKADLNNIALAGHSRGGEAAATAALFNRLAYYPDDANLQFHYGYAIKSVIAIAPVDGQYKPADQWRVLKDVNYLTLQGANDADISSFLGSRQYEHVQFSGRIPVFKSELYIYRANHSQFNSVWGGADHPAYARTAEIWFLNLRPLLSGDAQRQMTQLYVSGFLEATLHGRDEYRALFRHPDALHLNRYQDETYRAICSFDEDADLTTTSIAGGHITASGFSIWHEGKIPFRTGDRDYNGVFLGWDSAGASYTIDLPPMPDLPALDLSIAATEDDNGPTNFTIEATGANGQTRRIDASVPPPFHVRFTKLKWLDRQLFQSSSEPVFQSIHVPLTDLAKIRRIRLVFDKTPTATIIISGIGLEGV